MKKVFISVPMKGRTDEAIVNSIEKMHQIAEIIFGEELEPVHNFMSVAIPCDIERDESVPIYYLGKALEKMAICDYFIGVDNLWFFRGCQIEKEVAASYNMPKYSISPYRCEFLRDAVELDHNDYMSCDAVKE